MEHTNQLSNESSPYLLQHAHNPVNWLPYNSRVFDEAKAQNKPIIISIGYSSCHWCHVMEHESFENEEIASLMNALFVCVKVDREEHPDVDQVYMDAVQQIHGSGGWPLNCFALPDGRPFWGGTYFKPEHWKQLLLNVNELFQNRYADIESQAVQLTERLARQNFVFTNDFSDRAPNTDFAPGFLLLHSSFDLVRGGLKGAPKFPMPVVLEFLLRYGIYRKDETALQMVETTLQNMAKGGIYDQVGGGFARYSTDGDWKVPHFEKMLYDNAQLIGLYATAYKLTRNGFYQGVTEQTISFVDREFTSPEGIFYSALDADSQDEEGLFYTWTTDEFNDALGHYASLAGEYYGIGTRGMWEQDRNILLRPQSDELFAQQHFLSADELSSLTAYCRNQLLKVRSSRSLPGLDDKMIVAWNALMISALLDASIAFGNDAYLLKAVTAANFILKNLKRTDSGIFHTWKNGKSQINAFLDDYAFSCEAFLKLYSITTHELWLKETELLISHVIDYFYDSNSGFFWYSETGDKYVFARKIEAYDGVIPSGNSVMASVLHTVGTLLHTVDYLEKSQKMLLVMEKRFSVQPASYANWASLALSQPHNQIVIAVVGANSVSVIKELSAVILTGILLCGTEKESDLPYFVNRFVKGKTLIYVCSGTHCHAPVDTVQEALILISKNQR